MIVADDDGWDEIEVESEEEVEPMDSDEANAISNIDNDHSDA
jgi:hypothetical protein